MSTKLRIGFMPLADAAIVIAAARQNFDAEEGLKFDLVRETSWANVRDRLAIGQFDAAHLLAPMPVAAALRRAAMDAPLVAPMALGLGGNSVTVSKTLWHELANTGLALPGDALKMGRALKAVVEARRKAGARPLTFAVVHDYSAHNYELRHWLAASQILPDHDIKIGVAPPSLTPDALASGAIDGFCAGEPWGSVAVLRGVGAIILTKDQIWRASPEKVLGLRADFCARDPDLVVAIVKAMLRAAAWCGAPENRRELARLLAERETLDAPIAAVQPALAGEIPLADGSFSQKGLCFVEEAATFPWRSHARFFARAMARWGQAAPTAADFLQIGEVYSPDLYRRAAGELGVRAPILDDKPEGGPPSFEAIATDGEKMLLTASRFFDEKDLTLMLHSK